LIDFGFFLQSNLWTHSRIHNKIFGCDYCELKCATRGDLVLHMRTHTGYVFFEIGHNLKTLTKNNLCYQGETIRM
jgi:hypothetical protein